MEKLKQKKENIGSLFDNIAKYYDSLNHILSLNIDKYWRRKAVKMLDKKVLHLLDVATGTCDFAIEIIKQEKAEKITGIDLSNNMLEIGQKKINQQWLNERIHLQQEDCTQLTFEDNTFDAITCAFGVRNFNNLSKGLNEMFRVLKPKSKIIILEFSYPKNKVVRYFYDFYFTKILPLIGKFVSKDKQAYNYLPMSVKNFIWGEKFLEQMEKAGFKNTKYKTLTFGICTIYSAEKL
ncbi:MAG: bifunctional demethylmenaquinone methyltransferase/2-methoxy-6-polyprenyl-1,4-benzoquinol methylase UbiE [Bacteroidales bacterium]|nr:bifunctional demethylmenaquinone methyltransferase/2-methoxy-6-polyprenyl-1,4-benzoquinol methylase UbiE [Bacteroidales bacterium]